MTKEGFDDNLKNFDFLLNQSTFKDIKEENNDLQLIETNLKIDMKLQNEFTNQFDLKFEKINSQNEDNYSLNESLSYKLFSCLNLTEDEKLKVL